MARPIPQWRVYDRIGRAETYEDNATAFTRACELARGDRAVTVETPDDRVYVVIQRDLIHKVLITFEA